MISSGFSTLCACALTGLGFGDTFWTTDGPGEVQAMYAAGFRSISVAHSLGDPARKSHLLVAQAVGTALELGMTVRIPLHVDGNGGAYKLLPDSQYISGAQDLFQALLPYVATPKGSLARLLTIEVGNENYRALSPEGNDWPGMLRLYTELYPQVAQAARQTLAGCRVAVPAPGDQQCGLIEQSTPFIPTSAYAGYDECTVHYLAEKAYQTSTPLPRLVAAFRAHCGLPLAMSEARPDPAMIAVNRALGLPVVIWEWQCPGEPSVKGNAAALVAMGYKAAVTSAPQGYPVTRP